MRRKSAPATPKVGQKKMGKRLERELRQAIITCFKLVIQVRIRY
jgi:hypothetical protein